MLQCSQNDVNMPKNNTEVEKTVKAWGRVALTYMFPVLTGPSIMFFYCFLFVGIVNMRE